MAYMYMYVHTHNLTHTSVTYVRIAQCSWHHSAYNIVHENHTTFLVSECVAGSPVAGSPWGGSGRKGCGQPLGTTQTRKVEWLWHLHWCERCGGGARLCGCVCVSVRYSLIQFQYPLKHENMLLHANNIHSFFTLEYYNPIINACFRVEPSPVAWSLFISASRDERNCESSGSLKKSISGFSHVVRT